MANLNVWTAVVGSSVSRASSTTTGSVALSQATAVNVGPNLKVTVETSPVHIAFGGSAVTAATTDQRLSVGEQVIGCPAGTTYVAVISDAGADAGVVYIELGNGI